MTDKMTNQSAASFDYIAKILHSRTCVVNLAKKSLGNVLTKCSRQLGQTTLWYAKNGLTYWLWSKWTDVSAQCQRISKSGFTLRVGSCWSNDKTTDIFWMGVTDHRSLVSFWTETVHFCVCPPCWWVQYQLVLDTEWDPLSRHKNKTNKTMFHPTYNWAYFWGGSGRNQKAKLGSWLTWGHALLARSQPVKRSILSPTKFEVCSFASPNLV